MVIIGDKRLANYHSPMIVAEAGINHNGHLEMALEMVHVAKSVGADAIKFQTFKAEEFISDPSATYTYRSQGKVVTESMMAMFQRHEFSREQWAAIKRRCDEEEILFLSTPQNPSDLELLLELGIPAIKVGSDDMNNLPLLKRYSQTRLPIILSTGMGDLSEIYQSLDCIGALDGYPTVVLACTSQYPTPPEDVNILKVATLGQTFPSVPTGFSDHSEGPVASTLAVGLGACLFEKHFTLDHNLAGPDHWFSEDPKGLTEWVGAIRKAHRMLGSRDVRPTGEEGNSRRLARRSLVALTDIEAGEVLTPKNLGLNRPGTGLPPMFYEWVLGRASSRPIKRGEQIRLGDFGQETETAPKG